MKPHISLTIDDDQRKYRFQYYPNTLPGDDIQGIAKYMQEQNIFTGSHSIMGTRSYGSIFVEIANIDMKSLILDLDAVMQNYVDASIDKKTMLKNFENIIKKQYGIFNDPILSVLTQELIAAIEKIDFLASDIRHCNRKLKKGGLSDSEQLKLQKSIQETQYIIDEYNVFEDIRIVHDYCQGYCSLATKQRNINWGHTNIELKCNITLTKNNTMEMSYLIEELFELASLEHFKIVTCQIPIKACENCGKYFIPYVRSDEKYCDNIFKDGKTCKEIGYEIKLKGDAFKSAYRKAYKTQHARIRYNRHISDYEEKHFKPWEKAAKQALAEYTEKNDIQGLEKWLKDNRDAF